MSENITAACRGYAVSLLCAPCHPLVGVGYWDGVCESTCNSWYSACSEALFTIKQHGGIAPCLDDSLVCWPLKDLAQDGAGFCEQAGFKVGANSAPILQPYDSLLSRDGSSRRQLSNQYCFTGSSSGNTTAYEAISLIDIYIHCVSEVLM